VLGVDVELVVPYEVIEEAVAPLHVEQEAEQGLGVGARGFVAGAFVVAEVDHGGAGGVVHAGRPFVVVGHPGVIRRVGIEVDDAERVAIMQHVFAQVVEVGRVEQRGRGGSRGRLCFSAGGKEQEAAQQRKKGPSAHRLILSAR